MELVEIVLSSRASEEPNSQQSFHLRASPCVNGRVIGGVNLPLSVVKSSTLHTRWDLSKKLKAGSFPQDVPSKNVSVRGEPGPFNEKRVKAQRKG